MPDRIKGYTCHGNVRGGCGRRHPPPERNQMTTVDQIVAKPTSLPHIPNIIRVTIDHDNNTMDPMEIDHDWTLVTYAKWLKTDHEWRRIRRLLRTGYAFEFKIRDTTGKIVYCLSRCSTDTTDGVVIWDHDPEAISDKVEARMEDAENFLAEYTKWINGEKFRFRIERIKSVTPDFNPDDASFNGAFWEDVVECRRVIGANYTRETIESMIRNYPGAIIVKTGDATDILS